MEKRTLGIASILKMMKTGKLGGIIARTTRMTAGTALTTSDRTRTTSGPLEEMSGRDQTMTMTIRLPTKSSNG